ncbi:MAG: hypothetical protein JNG84_11345 [Archangium sp.]|nr:hypothetical protein [Archangium sp.]
MAPPLPFRRFTHPDGRVWEIRQNGKVLELRIGTDGDTVERRRPFDAPVFAAAELDVQVREQLAEGFSEHTPPGWTSRLNELIAVWEADDPGFDVDVLRGQVLAHGDEAAKAAIDHLAWLEEGQPRDPATAHAWFVANAETALGALVLALRYPDPRVLENVDSVLAELKRPEVIEGLLSVVEHPPAESRPSHMPLVALKALGKPDSDTALRLIHALDHDDDRSRVVAAQLLAEFSDDDGFFAALWERRAAAREVDGLCWAMLRAAEVRRDAELRDFLRWMQKSPRFRDNGYPERLGDALARLKNR